MNKKNETKLPLKEITIFSTSLCNLKCKYCYICKDNGVLKKLDDEIKRSHENLEYIEQIKNDFSEEDRISIEELEIWGGEPTLFLSRVTNTLDKYFEILPSLNGFFISSNFTSPNFYEEIKSFISKLEEMSEKYNKKINFNLQISIDGPKEINEINRGVGTTEKIIENFKKILSLKISENIFLKMHIKGTLSSETFDWFLNKDNIYKYYKFFSDNFYLPYLKEKESNNRDNLYFYYGAPNYAEPYAYTKEDGKKIAMIFKLIQEVENYEKTLPGLENMSLVPYVYDFLRVFEIYPFNKIKGETISSRGANCGHISQCISLGINGGYSVCHRGFFDAYVDYANKHNDLINEKYAANKAKITENNLWNYKNIKDFSRARLNAEEMYNNEHKAAVIQTKVLIQLYAYTGAIDEKYKDEENAILAANMFFNRSGCLQNSLENVGTMYLRHNCLIKLLLNGALDVILEEIEVILSRKKKKKE